VRRRGSPIPRSAGPTLLIGSGPTALRRRVTTGNAIPSVERTFASFIAKSLTVECQCNMATFIVHGRAVRSGPKGSRPWEGA